MIQQFAHVNVTVLDLDAAIDFFGLLGLELEARTTVEGTFLDTVIGIDGARTEIAMLRVPGSQTRVELSCFVRPASPPVRADLPANVPGIRTIAFVVDDLDAVVSSLAEAGWGLVGGRGEFEDTWAMVYVRGPEGVVVSLAQPLDGEPRT